MTLQQFLSKYLGKSSGYPNDNYFKGQCLSIVKLYIKEVLGLPNPPPSGSGSAYGYWSNFPKPLDTVLEKVENTKDLIPKEGWIAVWKPWASNPCGHISIVAKGSTTGTLKNYAQNWTSKVFQLESNRYTNVIGFLKPKVYNQSEESPMTKDETNALKAVKNLWEQDEQLNKGNLEGTANAVIGAYKDLKNARKDLEGARETLKTQQKIIDGLEGEVGKKDELLDVCQSQLKTANSKITKISKNLEDMTNDRDAWRKRYNDKNAELNEKLDEKINNMSAKKLFTLLINKLPWKK